MVIGYISPNSIKKSLLIEVFEDRAIRGSLSICEISVSDFLNRPGKLVKT
jgi:hypothetical protein